MMSDYLEEAKGYFDSAADLDAEDLQRKSYYATQSLAASNIVIAEKLTELVELKKGEK